MNLDQLAEEVLRRLREKGPRVLLIGELPPGEAGSLYVREPPYEQICIGYLEPGELLRMPSNAVCHALMDGIPVWLWPQPYRKGKHAILLRKALMEAEQRLLRYGVRPIQAEQWRKEMAYGCWNSNRKFLGNEEM